MMNSARLHVSPGNKAYRSRVARVLIVVAAMIGVLMSGQMPTSATSATDPSNITVGSDGVAITLEFAEQPCIGSDQPGCDPANPSILLGRFTVTADGTTKTVNSNRVTVTSTSISFNINAGGPSDMIERGQEVVVSYTAPSELGQNGLELVGTPNVLVASFEVEATNNSILDFTAPTLESVEVSEDRGSVVVTFDEPVILGPGATVTVTVTEGGVVSTVSLGTISANGSSVTLPLQNVVSSGDVEVVYRSNPPGWTDESGNNQVPDFDETATFAPQQAPQLLEGTAPSLASNGTSLTLTFDETLAAAMPETSAFTVMAGGSEVEVSSVENSGATSVLTLAEPIVEDADVTISYDAPDSGGYQDAAGNLVASFTDEDVDNSSTVAAPTTPASPAIRRPRPAPTTTPPTTVPSSPSTTTPTNTGAPNETTPTRVNDGNQDELTAAAGAAKAMVGGEEVELNVISAAVETDGAIAPEQRTTEQVTELQEMATDIVTVLDVAAGGSSGLEVVETDTGAEIEGIFADAAVPVEDVLVVENGTFAGLYASRDDQGNPVKIRADIVEMKRGGEVAVIVYGLPAGEEAELVLMSIPYLLDSVQIDESGGFTRYVSLPSSVQSGDHTLVTASDTVTISLGVRVSDPVRELPVTGTQTPLVPALFVLGLGSIMIGITRQRRWWTH